MKIYVLWGTPINEPDWAEEILCESRLPIDLEKAQQWGIDNGYKNIRILETFDGDVPEFT